MRQSVIILALFLSFKAAAAPTPLFSSDEVLKAVLTAPITQAYQQKNNLSVGAMTYETVEKLGIRLR